MAGGSRPEVIGGSRLRSQRGRPLCDPAATHMHFPFSSHQRLLRRCAVERRRFSVGESPTRRDAPAGSNRSNCGGNEAVEASGDQRVTKYGDVASVQAVTRVNAEQASKRTMRGPTRPSNRGRLTWVGEQEQKRGSHLPRRGGWRQHVHKGSARNTGSPMAWSGRTDQTPARECLGALG